MFNAEVADIAEGDMRREKMDLRNRKISFRSGVTLVELIIAVAMVTIIFAALLPQFALIRNSWDSKQGTAEALQNGRVLMDHISRNLSKAKRITAASASSVTNGYIQFVDNNDVNNRYDIGANNYVEYGPQPGTLSELAGPVSSLTFTCYSACDLNTPITDPNIRVVKVDATFTNSGALGQDKTFTTWANLQSNGNNPAGLTNQTPFEFDTTDGRYPALAQIDSTHYLCAFGRTNVTVRGDAVVLSVNPSTWAVTAPAGRFEYDATSGQYPALAQIDSTHYFCAYSRSGLGNAIVLAVNPVTWAVTAPSIRFEFDGTSGTYPAWSQIDSTHYLCAYTGNNTDGFAVVLTVDLGTWAITKATPVSYEYDTLDGVMPALARIDSTHYLCVYTQNGSDGWAVVLTVDPSTWVITWGPSFEYDTSNGQYPALAQIDSTHYLCAYTGPNGDGWAVVLTVNTGTWAVTRSTPYEFDTADGTWPALAQIDSDSFLCSYTGTGSDGWAVVLNVNTSGWTISKETPYEFDIANGLYPVLVKIYDGSCADDWRYLCAYTSTGNDGWSAVLNYTELRP